MQGQLHRSKVRKLWLIFGTGLIVEKREEREEGEREQKIGIKQKRRNREESMLDKLGMCI